jgi:AcrR family transcriptional regulator
MFKKEGSEATREHIFRVALELFRTRGFDKTTMREVAKQAGLSLGAAYYYYRSKEDIVGAYYEHVQKEHLRQSRAGLAKARNLKQRLEAALHGKLDVVAGDRLLMTALFRYGGDPNHPLCWFGPETERHRQLSMAVFDEALEGEKLPRDLRDAMPVILWAMHMGVLLFLLFDDSPKQERTRKLTDHAITLTLQAMKLLRVPLVRTPARKVIAALNEAELIPDADSWRRLAAELETA